ncbi:hypothetical protein GCM10023205_21100 [Yinghuangia aomiensis]|uniref:non-specific serine/threonine protein kinase n=1 Tax=Yinghuangia aomiensis TaxID=676205 RepID=A0ABP9H2G2_9ACTN
MVRVGWARVAGVGFRVQRPASGSPADPLASLPPDGYTVVRTLRSDAHGTVLLCRADDDALRAVEVLRAGAGTEASRLALHAELLAAAAAGRHPCAVPVHDVGVTADGRGFVVRDFLEGDPVAGPLPVTEVVLAGIRCALVLRAAHCRGVLHLDVRPGVLLRGGDDEVYLSGVGIARVLARTSPSAAEGRDPAYVPRELAGWELPGPAADVYLLGATLYALLDGVPDDADDVLFRALVDGRPPRPHDAPVPARLADLLRRMAAPYAADRPSLGEVHGVLCGLVPHEAAERVPRLDPEPDEPDPLLRPDPPEEPYEDEEDDPDHAARQRRRRRWIAGIAVTAAVLFAGGAYTVTQTGGGGGKSRAGTGNTPAAAVSPGAPRLLAGSQAAQFTPKDVTTAAFGGSTQVAWQPPGDSAPVAGFLVLAQDPQTGAVADRRQIPSGTSNAVFTLPKGAAACFTVTTLVRMPDGTLGLAPAPQVCPPRPSATPPTARP